jgi:hypothetical protein
LWDKSTICKGIKSRGGIMNCKCEEIKKRLETEYFDKDVHRDARCDFVLDELYKIIKHLEQFIKEVVPKYPCRCPLCGDSLCDWCDTIENFGEKAKEAKDD